MSSWGREAEPGIQGKAAGKMENSLNMTGKKNKNDYKFYVYILANQRNGTLYIGMTNNIINRSFQHKLKQDRKSFTAKYNTDKLVHYEFYQYVNDAIQREKELKRYKRQWKIELIEKGNPAWRDLFNDFE